MSFTRDSHKKEAEASKLGWGRYRPYEQVFGNLVSSIITNRADPWYYSPLFHVGYIEFNMQLQGSRYRDFRDANIRAGISMNGYSPFGCTWHHVYNTNFDANTGSFLMQLVDRQLHFRTVFHVGAFRQGKEAGLYRKYTDSLEIDKRAMTTTLLQEKENSSDVERGLWEIQQQYYKNYVFPRSLVDFYERYVHQNFRPKKLQVDGSENFILTQLYPLYGDYAFQLGRTVATMQSNGNFPVKLAQSCIPFAEDGFGNVYYLQLSSQGQNEVPIYFLDHETGESIKVFESLTYLIGSWGELTWKCSK